VSVLVETIVAARKNEQVRNSLLEQLEEDYRPQIKTMLSKAKLGYQFDVSMASQEFLIAANKAIDSARLEDDGRGKNNPIAWCGYSGLLGVRRAIYRLQQTNERQTERLESYDDEHDFWTTRDIADEIVGDDTVSKFMTQLTEPEQQVVKLLILGYGPSAKGSGRRNWAKEIAELLDMTEKRVRWIITALQKKANYLELT
jgi:hypothetical protein